ncbi:MAG: phospho-N-acetylmuramoyl-pentapeptide-transferase [Eubacteriales bacterium]|nr:phospho-N-acetylmuramoyl-pentapeptide-transferase [Eubacteriales bacterium]MDO5585658.1 phospho-N-acetylmuramoyl-pentapeptide-transferase [Clostridia bacterium]MDY4214152.1 phospho-N-acetylmuramoyl-pentapeptide-transferase [Eubacteriales bacterium]MDY5230212.1 phospho-N-acetylmuramoyl-pentapeptide-transferase [Eubacteriales bacterium]
MYLFIGAIGAFIISLCMGMILIPVLHKLKFGQEIREEGPKWHAKKSGTPTMGGLIFIAAIFAMSAICCVLGLFFGIDMPADSTYLKTLVMLLCLSAVYGVIGFIDDYIKVILKRNLGLTAKQKFLLQLVAAVGFVCWAVYGMDIATVVKIPFTSIELDFGIWFVPFAALVIIATVNSVNLTDGLDGLATCVTCMVALFFILFADKVANRAVALFASILLGSLMGFLMYNKFPAKVFMGDTGSLFLGGAVCGMAIVTEQPLALLIVGLVYVIESLSVILQVISFKTTGKRIFKMSPIHHHFEMCGWSETKIVITFTIVTAVLCLLMLNFG